MSRRKYNINKVNEEFDKLPKYKQTKLNRIAMRIFNNEITPEYLIKNLLET